MGRIKKIIWIRTEVKEIENNRKTNQVFLKKINKIDKTLAIWLGKKGENINQQ